MARQGGWPGLSPDYVAAARSYAVDVAAAIILFTGASLIAGRVRRFPFDDELIVLASIESHRSLASLVHDYLAAGDIHPPLSFVLFYLLGGLGLGEAGMRLCSLAMTAGALALFHVTALTLLVRRHGGAVRMPSRLVAVLVFGLCALAVSQGDAIRWYPLFALLAAVCVTFYMFAANAAALGVAAAALGLAASTNFIAILLATPLAIFRYALQRRFEPRLDLTLAATTAIFAAPGLISAASILARRLGGVAHSEFGNSLLVAVATHGLGFFGGAAIGIGLFWVAVPAMVIAVLAVVAAIDRREPASPQHLLVLLLAASVPMVLAGFAKPRSFLYLAPVLAVLVTLYVDRLFAHRRAVAAAAAALTVAISVTAIANVDASTHPFKRSAVIPYRAVLDFIEARQQGRVLVISTDPVVPWVLNHDGPSPNRCASNFLENRRCFGPGASYDTVFVVSGHSSYANRDRILRRYAAEVARMTEGKTVVASMTAGYDADAALKQTLTGVRLGPAILTVEFYR
jgi:hypothetical protein